MGVISTSDDLLKTARLIGGDTDDVDHCDTPSVVHYVSLSTLPPSLSSSHVLAALILASKFSRDWASGSIFLPESAFLPATDAELLLDRKLSNLEGSDIPTSDELLKTVHLIDGDTDDVDHCDTSSVVP